MKHVASGPTPIKPLVDAMRADALKRYGVPVTENQMTRGARQAQAFHICHMFLYNYFKHQKPTTCTPGHRTIAWDHLSAPSTKWALIDDTKGDYLLTANGQPARMNGSTWAVAPDESASRKAMTTFLEKHKVKSMAAPGLDLCGAPCGCGGHASKHITGQACDLSKLHQLGVAIIHKELGLFVDPDAAVDRFLAYHGLCRPLAHPGKSQELWHVEALSDHPHAPRQDVWPPTSGVIYMPPLYVLGTAC
jgi:hypothetical protein